jgi:hypothetical protein
MPLTWFEIGDESGGQNMADGHRTYNVTAFGLNDNPNELLPTILMNDKLLRESVTPFWGADISAVLTDIKGATNKKISEGMIWKFDLVYSTKKEEEKDGEEDVRYNPTKQAAVIIPTFTETEIHSLTDYTKKLVINNAGELFTGFTKKVGCNRFQITKSIEFNGELPKWWKTHQLAVNKDDVTILGLKFPPLTLLVSFNGSEKKQKFGVKYIDVNFDILENPLEWRFKSYNVGLYEQSPVFKFVEIEQNEFTPIGSGVQKKVQTGFEFKRILDEEGQAITEPVPLDKNGTALREYDKELKKWVLKRKVDIEKECELLDYPDHNEVSFSVLPLT